MLPIMIQKINSYALSVQVVFGNAEVPSKPGGLGLRWAAMAAFYLAEKGWVHACGGSHLAQSLAVSPAQIPEPRPERRHRS